MIRNDTDIPFINQVLVAHRAKGLVYRPGPARKVQLVVPSVPLPSPQSAIIRTVRPIIRRLNASFNILTTNGRCESGDLKADPEATETEDAKTDRVGKETSSHARHEEERYPKCQSRLTHRGGYRRRRAFRTPDFDGRKSEDTLGEKDDRIVVRTHRPLCPADFEDSDDEESFCNGVNTRVFDLEASRRRSNSNNELKGPHGRQLTTLQLRIKANMLRKIAQEAFKARETGENESNIFSKEASEEGDWVLEMTLQLMQLGQLMTEAGELSSEEGGDIEMMVQNSLGGLMQKATRPFRPTGIRVVEDELFQCLEAFRQMRLELLAENAGMCMAEILNERRLDLRSRSA